MPHLPQPQSDEQALAVLHHARTQALSLRFNARAYSHRWLLDHGLPSGLPDELKPKAERMYPVIADVVGIAVGSKYPVLATKVRSAMEYAVLDCYANGDKDPAIVKPQMMVARQKTLRQLLG